MTTNWYRGKLSYQPLYDDADYDDDDDDDGDDDDDDDDDGDDDDADDNIHYIVRQCRT